MPEKWLILLLFLIGGILIWFLAILIRDSNRFVIVEYRVESSKLRKKCRVVMLSDLHDKEYGKGNESLVQAIHEAAPELILIAGDMVTANEEKRIGAPLWS